MLQNRSVPTSTVLLDILCRDVAEAIWLSGCSGSANITTANTDGMISGAQMHLDEAWIRLTRVQELFSARGSRLSHSAPKNGRRP